MAAKTARSSPSGSLNQETLSLQVSLPQMLDLALGTPEVGAVNLNILHNFLHVLLHQIDLRSTKVEYRGDEADRIKGMISTTKAGPSLELHEYNIIDASGNTMQRTRRSDTGINADVYTESGSSGIAASAPTTARGSSGKEGSKTNLDDGHGTGLSTKTSGLKRKIGSGLDVGRQSVIFVEPVMNGSTPTALGFKRLENSVRELQQKFQALDEIANNSDMIERVKSNAGDPLSDMWHGISVSKRLDASEQGIEKLTTMVQDLIKSDKTGFEGGGNIAEELGQLNERIVELENHVGYLGGDVSKLKDDAVNRREEIRETTNESVRDKPSEQTAGSSRITLAKNGETEVGSRQMEDNDAPSDKRNAEDGVDANGPFDHEATDGKAGKKVSLTSTRRSVIGGIDLGGLKDDVKALRSEMTIVQKNVQDLNMKIMDVVNGAEPIHAGIDAPRSKNDDPSRSTLAADSTAARSAGAVSTAKEIAFDVESVTTSQRAASKSSVGQVSRVTGKDRTASSSHVALGDVDDEGTAEIVETSGNQVSHSNSPKDLASRIAALEREMACVIGRINSEFGVDGTSGIGDLVAKVQAIQTNMEKIDHTASRLMEEKDNRDIHTDALIEQIELLKTIKADKEDLEDALADKADARAVNRKVSHDQFDAACDDLARGLEDAITKLSQQESIWQQALDVVQREIEGKLDKIEISPLKEFVDDKLRVLQEKLKALAEMRRENEAAGTKKMLSDVQCISCDANVVMRMEEGAHYRAPALPCTKSMKPYLTYELDQVRKQQRRLPHSRNMIQFEAAMQEMTRKSKPLKEDLAAKSPRDHLCNRYCGGSHTITTPQQRVMRMGHFLTQWGPEAVQLGEGVVLGTDGQLYRGRPVLGKTDVNGPSGNGDSAEVHSSNPPVPEPPLSQRQSQTNQRRSSTSQLSRRLSARKTSERMKETVEQKIEEIPAEPSTPPSAPPGTVVDEGDAIPEPPGSTGEVVRDRTSEGGNQTPVKLERRDTVEQGQED